MAEPVEVAAAATTQVLLIRTAAGPTYSRVVAPGHQPVRLLLREDAQLLQRHDLLPSDLSTHDVGAPDNDQPADFSVKTLRSEALGVQGLSGGELESHGDLTQSELGSSDLTSSEFKADIPSPAYKEPLSVQVIEEQTEAHDYSQLSPAPLSPREDIPTSVHNMIDATDFRSLPQEPMYQNLSSLGGRMSPSAYSPSSSYATLTPLQPLPPISTVSDRFAYGHPGNVSGSFTVMQNNGSLGNVNLNSPYHYDKSHMSMSPPHYSANNGLMMQQQPSPLSPQNYSHNGMHSPQKSLSPENYNSPYTREDLSRATLAQPQSPALSLSVSLHSPPSSSFNGYIATTTLTTSALTPGGFTNMQAGSLGPLSPHAVSPHSPTLQLQSPPSPAPQLRDTMHALSAPNIQAGGNHIQQAAPQQQHQPPLTPVHQQACKSSGSSSGSDCEELNTKELAQRISAELKRYSIPQAIFAQRVLCRSQGTLSDLLRNPKPWSKLKSGRETFRRMWKWLQEPEFQRMSSLRLAGQSMTPSHHAADINAGTPSF